MPPKAPAAERQAHAFSAIVRILSAAAVRVVRCARSTCPWRASCDQPFLAVLVDFASQNIREIAPALFDPTLPSFSSVSHMPSGEWRRGGPWCGAGPAPLGAVATTGAAWACGRRRILRSRVLAGAGLTCDIHEAHTRAWCCSSGEAFAAAGAGSVAQELRRVLIRCLRMTLACSGSVCASVCVLIVCGRFARRPVLS